jgi:hypothetical protein
MDWSSKVESACTVPWEKETWGVAIDFADGFHVTYPVGSQIAAIEHCNKLMSDPEFALKVRWGKQSTAERQRLATSQRVQTMNKQSEDKAKKGAQDIGPKTNDLIKGSEEGEVILEKAASGKRSVSYYTVATYLRRIFSK